MITIKSCPLLFFLLLSQPLFAIEPGSDEEEARHYDKRPKISSEDETVDAPTSRALSLSQDAAPSCTMTEEERAMGVFLIQHELLKISELLRLSVASKSTRTAVKEEVKNRIVIEKFCRNRKRFPDPKSLVEALETIRKLPDVSEVCFDAVLSILKDTNNMESVHPTAAKTLINLAKRSPSKLKALVDFATKSLQLAEGSPEREPSPLSLVRSDIQPYTRYHLLLAMKEETNLHSRILGMAESEDFESSKEALVVLRACNPPDPIVHQGLLNIFSKSRQPDLRVLALEALSGLKTLSSETQKGIAVAFTGKYQGSIPKTLRRVQADFYPHLIQRAAVRVLTHLESIDPSMSQELEQALSDRSPNHYIYDDLKPALQEKLGLPLQLERAH